MIKTITLDGLTSVKIKQSAFDMERFCWVKNRSDGDIFISCTDVECTENGDNVMKISAGEYGMIDSESREILYLNGSGKVEIVTSAYAVCPFKAASKGGGSYELPIATTEILGGVMPDGTTITADENGVISVVNSKSSYRKMTAIIDLTNTNPETCITYAEDAIYLSAKSSDWDDFFGEYPVLLKDGVEVGRLNPNNFNQFEDGTAVDTTSGDAGDVMIAFPRRGIRITTSDSGDTLIISMTDDPDDPNYTYYAHTRGAIRKDVFYLGAYQSYVSDDKMRSLYDKTITANKTIGEFRTYAHNLGEGYENSGFYQLIFRQVMYILKYKNLNSQKTVGLGYYESDSAVNTGGTYHRGMTWGLTANNKVQVKLFGIEDFWGNMYEDVDGVCSDSNRHILTATDNFNDTGDGYTDQGLGADSDIFGYMLKPQGTSECGFIPKSVEGSSTTGFCDRAILRASIPYFGGYWNGYDSSGAFCFCFDTSASTPSGPYIGSRLMYL